MAYTRYVYTRTNWKNKSESMTTPVGKTNMNHIEDGIYNIAENLDVAYNELDSGKFNESNAGKVIVGMPTWDADTGILTFRFYDGTEFSVDFNIEKIPVSFSMDSAGVITMTTEDGTQWTANIGDVIPDYKFEDSDRITFVKTKNADGSYTIVADIKKNSITGDYLESNYLANITTQASNASSSAESAADSANDAAYDAKLAQSYAIGGSGIRDDDTDNAKYYKEQAKNSSDSASNSASSALASSQTATTKASEATTSATNASISESNANTYATNASNSATSASGSSTTATQKASEASTSATNASNSANTATTKANEAKSSADAAALSESNALASETAAAQSESNAKTSESNASNSAKSASASATSASSSATTATNKATEAANSASDASTSANTATTKAIEASSSASSASQSASSASTYSTKSQSYAVGGTGTRENEDIDNAKYYYQQSKSISESFSGALRPMGTVAFANLPSVANASEGDMYNISDQFTTTTDFKEGSGLTIPAGSNIYKTYDGYWDILAGSPVTGVKGSAESEYRSGNVNITPESIGVEEGANKTIVDSELSEKSTNAVQNKVVNAAIEEISNSLPIYVGHRYESETVKTYTLDKQYKYLLTGRRVVYDSSSTAVITSFANFYYYDETNGKFVEYILYGSYIGGINTDNGILTVAYIPGSARTDTHLLLKFK